MKVLFSTVIMVAVAATLIFRMYTDTQQSIQSMEGLLGKHFSLVKAGNYQQAYANFHQELQQRISLQQYTAAWQERIAKYGPMQSWRIHTGNTSSNLFSNEKEYDVVLFITFGTEKELVDRVYHLWRIEESGTKLIYSGLHSTASNSSNFAVY